MKRVKRLLWLSTFVAAAILEVNLGVSPCSAYTPSEVYTQLKELELNRFQFPSTIGSGYVGQIEIYRQGGKLKTSFRGPQEFGRSKVTVNGVEADLIFKPVACNHWDIVVTALYKKGRLLWKKGDGGYFPTTFDGNQVHLNVGIADRVIGTIRANDPATNAPAETCNFAVTINRAPGVNGVGAFTIPVLPIAIVYAPPQGIKGGNSITYTTTDLVGTTFSTSFSSENSTTKPTAPSKYAGIGDLKNVLSRMGDVYSYIPKVGLYAKFIADFIAKGMGNASATSADGTGKVEGTKLTITDTNKVARPTPPGSLPGSGDIYIFLKNVMVAWTAEDNDIGITLLGAEKILQIPVQDLKDDLALFPKPAEPQPPAVSPGDPEFPSQPSSTPTAASGIKQPATANIVLLKKQENTAAFLKKSPLTGPGKKGKFPGVPLKPVQTRTGLDYNTLKELIALDPLAEGGPNTELKEPRFKRVTFGTSEEFETFIDIPEYSVTHTITNEDSLSTSKFTTHTEDYSKGYLSFLGIGVLEDKKLSSTTKITNARTTTIGHTVESKLTLNIDETVKESICLKAYYDRAFGTFIFQRVDTSGAPIHEGTATDANGRPIANSWVTLTAGGKSFAARTDTKGRYQFRSTSIPQGPATLKTGGLTKNITINRNIINRKLIIPRQ